MSPQQADLLGRIGSLLYVREYNRRFLAEQSGQPELSQTEFVVLSVYEFHRQLFINGFDGFLFNTDATYADFLPIALTEIGATRYALLVRLAWEERKVTEGRFDDRFFDLVREEPYDELLVRYVERHRHALPDPALATPEFFAKWESDRDRWWGEKNRDAEQHPSP